ncbi:MAG: 1,4-alpha-glucan branching protein GlgB [Calditrichaeota bacterium]|nr:1,4-alpha-glucan branching protein GlgB [Calditrichota bacterium]MCB9391148.1 1,4-alpha-glucan branching protein GlgB [Calditrichota bacterium]
MSTRLTSEDLYLFNEGSHFRLYKRLGAHLDVRDGNKGVSFTVWAPDARDVSVVGEFNSWQPDRNPLSPVEHSGIWEGFVPGAVLGQGYKYHIRSRASHYEVDKADPFAFRTEMPPNSASVVHDLAFEWHDKEWMNSRAAKNADNAPISIYEMHLGSWDKVHEDGGRSLHYRELAPRLIKYLHENGFTHVEFMPVMEHPYYGSWGYQTTSYFAPSARYGSPQDLMYLIDQLHLHGIGVILDWVPSHFATDEFALGYFDGTYVYEHADRRQGFHPDWGSFIFNYGRTEVQSFLISSAFFWLDVYHADGLRVDGVASMLYLDYSRQGGDWIPNKYGGKENVDAIEFLKRLNHEVGVAFPGTLPVAEESTSWAMVTRPPYIGGLGFRMKWDMGWMHDTLQYMALDPVFRKYHHHLLTFRMLYAYTENFVLPLSHDEVVHGKGSLLGKMNGDMWQKFANLRSLYGYMWSMPGKKLLFMGGEIAQWREWSHDDAVDWNLLDFDSHSGMQRWVRDLNKLYTEEGALHKFDFQQEGFEWIDCHDFDQSTFVFLRKGEAGDSPILVALNFTPVPRHNYRVGVPVPGEWIEVLNSDAASYWGSGVGNLGKVTTSKFSSHGHAQSLSLTLPPLAAVFLKGPASK